MKTVCEHCAQDYDVDPIMIGKKAMCEACGNHFTIRPESPKPAAASAAPKPAALKPEPEPIGWPSMTGMLQSSISVIALAVMLVFTMLGILEFTQAANIMQQIAALLVIIAGASVALCLLVFSSLIKK